MKTTQTTCKAQCTFSMQHKSNTREGWIVGTGMEESRIALESLLLP